MCDNNVYENIWIVAALHLQFYFQVAQNLLFYELTSLLLFWTESKFFFFICEFPLSADSLICEGQNCHLPLIICNSVPVVSKPCADSLWSIGSLSYNQAITIDAAMSPNLIDFRIIFRLIKFLECMVKRIPWNLISFFP